jgi:hypothetical protein
MAARNRRSYHHRRGLPAAADRLTTLVPVFFRLLGSGASRPSILAELRHVCSHQSAPKTAGTSADRSASESGGSVEGPLAAAARVPSASVPPCCTPATASQRLELWLHDCSDATTICGPTGTRRQRRQRAGGRWPKRIRLECPPALGCQSWPDCRSSNPYPTSDTGEGRCVRKRNPSWDLAQGDMRE